MLESEKLTHRRREFFNLATSVVVGHTGVRMAEITLSNVLSPAGLEPVCDRMPQVVVSDLTSFGPPMRTMPTLMQRVEAACGQRGVQLRP
jgi:hypothetical protein